MRQILISSLSLGLVASLGAQQQLVVPSAYRTQDATSMRWVAGLTSSLRQQLVIQSSALAPMLGKQIDGISFRRDTGIPKARPGGASDLHVRISSGGATTTAPSEVMSRNHGTNLQTVFQGRVVIPASAATSLGYVSWQGSDVVKIVFSTPFLYRGGDLCVDVEGVPVPGQSSGAWPVDAIASSLAGQVTNLGSSGSPFPAAMTASGERVSSFVSPRQLVAGNTVVFQSRGTPLAPASLMIGVATLTQPLNLGFLGAPTSNLYVQPIVVLGAVYSAPLVASYPNFGATAVSSVLLPAVPGILGSQLTVQWVDFGPPLSTSNAFVCRVAATPPVAEVSIVSGVYDSNGLPPSRGTVDIGAGLVIRFDYH